MGEAEAIEIARRVAEAEEWPWDAPVRARASRRWIIFGRRSWRVTTNHRQLRPWRHVEVVIDDVGRAVVSKAFYDPPR